MENCHLKAQPRSQGGPARHGSPPTAGCFVIGGFLLMWLVGLYPLLASVVADISPVGAVALLVLLPSLMTAVLYPLWLAEERRDAG